MPPAPTSAVARHPRESAGGAGGCRPPRRARGRLIAIAVGLFAGALLAEVALRVVVFSEAPLARRLGARFREPSLFAPPGTDDFWKLQHLFLDQRIRGESAPGTDARLGWTGPVAPGTYELPHEPGEDGRRLVLLYGDSFAQCDTPASECFAALLEGSDLGGRFVLGNFGVGGYGADQMLLLLRNTVDRYRERDPVVIVALLAEDDLDRCVLSFRGWPKPRFRLRGEELELEAPVETDVARHLAARPVSISSYAARLFGLPLGLVPRAALPAPIEERAALSRAILLAIDAELDARGLDHFFYVFHGAGAFSPDASRWQDELIAATCREADVPLLSSRPYLLAACGGDPARVARFFGETGHLNPTGNRVAFEGLRQGLLGRFGGEDTARVDASFAAGAFEGDLEPSYPRRLLGLDARVRAVEPDLQVRCFASASGGAPWFLSLRPGAAAPLRVTWTLPEGTRRFRASARTVRLPDAPATPPLELALSRGGAPRAQRHVFEWGGEARELELDLAGASQLVIELAPAGDDAGGVRLLLQRAILD